MTESRHNSRDPWFAIRVKSRFEKVTAAALQGKGFEEFLPLYRTRRQWSDRIAEVELPLFAGYVFCRFNPKNRLPIVTTPGFVSIVSFGADPVPVDETEIESIRAILRSGYLAEPWPYLRAGQTVRIEHGSMAGVEGILIESKKHHRLVVSVTILQRSVAVDVDSAWVTPVGPIPNLYNAAL